jgi:2-methylcitrate dehydratase PrpD
MNPKHSAISPLMAELSAYVAGALDRPLPPAVAEKTKAHLIDTIAAIVSGSRLRPGLQGIAYARLQGGTPEAQIITGDFLSTAGSAAFANGMMAHGDETDDSHKASRAHLGCSVIPAALAMAEKQRAGGEALLRAIALGYDIGSRVLFALDPLRFHQAGHCTHAFAGVFGSAAAAAALARLTPERARWSLSYAAQQAAGITSWRRAVEHVEKAFVFAAMPARNGVEAAAMVAAGFTGVNDVFAGAQNFFISFGRDAKPELLVDALGARFEIMRTTIKKWSVGSPAQSVLDAVQALMTAHRFDHHEIAEIAIRMFPLEIDTVDDRAMPDISVQHLVAVLLIDRDLTFASSHDHERMHDPAVVALKGRITLTPDSGVERQRALVTIALTDRRSLSHRATAVHGTPDNPMSAQDVTHKALGLTAPVLGEARTRELIETLWNVDTIVDMRTLRRLLGAAPAAR